MSISQMFTDFLTEKEFFFSFLLLFLPMDPDLRGSAYFCQNVADPTDPHIFADPDPKHFV